MDTNETATSKKPMNKTEILLALSESTGLAKPQVAALFDQLSLLIKENLSEAGPGVFVFPDLLQIKVQRKPATEERTGLHPITKQEMVFKAKPAQNVVKLVALKRLKEMV